jgi:REP element-mobilizing transposase RayT
VFSRGSNRQSLFALDSDRIDFLQCLDTVMARSALHCLAYCLMPNHYHLVLHTEDGEVSAAMKRLNHRYSLRFNRRYGRDAHLFRNRFGAILQETESQLLWTLRYTVMNPVESELCGRPEEWPWSSYRASIGIEPAPRFLDVPRLLSYYGGAVSERAMPAYRDHVDGLVGA